jgi:hypothetical protein
MEIFELELDVFKLFLLSLMNSWAKNSWLKYLNLWSCSSTRYVIWINFIKFLCIQQTSTFITQELRIKSLKQFIKTYGPKQFHVIIFFYVGPIKFVCLTAYLWVNSQTISCSNLSELNANKY